jgi:hypothetical protein
MLAIKSPATNACPANAKLKAWIYTTRAGPVTYMMIRHGQGAGTPKVVMAKKVGGKYVAEISQTLTDSPGNRCTIPYRRPWRRRFPVLQLGAAEGELHDSAGRLTPWRSPETDFTLGKKRKSPHIVGVFNNRKEVIRCRVVLRFRYGLCGSPSVGAASDGR